MKERLNQLGRALTAARNKAEYDEAVKEILANKQILAWILKWTTTEFKNMEIDEIILCIENPSVAKVHVYPGLTNEIMEAIEGQKNESKILGEKYITYDVRFSVMVPGGSQKTPVRIVVDVEAQKTPYPGYDIVSRGVFYGGRMLSDQMGRNLDGEDYDKLEKVYSIWLIFNCPQKNANTTISYTIQPEMVYGEADLEHRYDLMSVMEVRIPGEKDADKCKNRPSEFHSMLYDVFVRKEDVDTKMKRLETNYHLKTKELEGRLTKMCNLSEAIEESGVEKFKALCSWLLAQNRIEDLKRITDDNDSDFQNTLFEEMIASNSNN